MHSLVQVYSLEKWPIQPERIPVAICSMKWLEELPHPPPPPNPYGMPAVHFRLPLPIAFFQASLKVYRDPFTLLGGERHWKSIKRRALPSALSPKELPIPLDRIPVHRRLEVHITLLGGERHWKSIKRRALPSALSPEELPIPLDWIPVHHRLPLLTLLTGFSGSSRYTPGWREALGRVSTIVPHPHSASFCKFLS